MQSKERKISVLHLPSGESPCITWLNKLDKVTCARIFRRIDRLKLGNFGDWKQIGGGVFELRLNFGPGYRIYYGLYKDEVIVLIHGGEKKSQEKDITSAKALWKEFKNEIERFRRNFV